MQNLIPLWGGTRDSEFPNKVLRDACTVGLQTMLERQGPRGTSITCPEINTT